MDWGVYNIEIDYELALTIAERYCSDLFSTKMINSFEEKKLIDFVLEHKFRDFELFLNNFLDFTKHDARLNSLLANNNVFVEKVKFGVKFIFLNENEYEYDLESREINYLFEMLENFMYSISSHTSSDFVINTDYNEFEVLFYPNWN